jgi:lipid II:glycine glycyltransferase (peptidoglycan interpeptide bridge formation enzyme)
MPDELGPVVEVVSDDDWDILLKQFADANYRQLAAYSSAAATRIKARSENVAIREDGKLLGLCNVRIRKLPLLPFGIAYVNGAPLALNSAESVDSLTALSRCLKALRKEFVDVRGHVLRVVGVARADMSADSANGSFMEAGFEPCAAKGRYRTILVDLMRDLPEIRRGLDQKWRNVLNKAERQGLEVVRGTEAAFFREFSELYSGLVARKNLDVDLGPEFFLGLQDELSEPDRFVVHLAKQGDNVVAGHIGAYHGDTAVYLLGAANEAGLKTNASYLLQWRVIEYAKERGCNWYDLGGIDPEGNPDVYRFKARIGGTDVVAPGPYESGTPARRKVSLISESLYRMIRK